MLDGIYKVVRKVGLATFFVADLVDPDAHIPFMQPVNADRLVRLDMPELELSANQPRRLEMRASDTQPFNEYTIEKFGVDGRVLLRLEGGNAEWHDLTQCEYRWLA